jgi:BMFP domain-containing protein YqiC
MADLDHLFSTMLVAGKEEAAAIKAGQEKMRAMLNAIRTSQAESEVSVRKRVESILASVDRKTHDLLKNLSSMIQKAHKVRHELETNLAKVEAQARPGGSRSAAAFLDRDTGPKGPRSPWPECSSSERLVCWLCEGTGHLPRNSRQGHPQKDFQNVGRPRPEKQVEDTKRKALKPPLPLIDYIPREDSICVQGRIGDMSVLVTIDTGASMTFVRPDIAAGLPQRKLTRRYYLKTCSGETQPMEKRSLVEMTLGPIPIRFWAFVANIVDEFILGLDVLHTYSASVDLGRRVLRLAQEEVALELSMRNHLHPPYEENLAAH